jgi:hypothetical protein
MAKIQYTISKTGENNNIPPAIKEMMLSSLNTNEVISFEPSKKDIRRFFKDESKKLKRLLRRSH